MTEKDLRPYWNIEKATLNDLLAAINDESQKRKIHVINVFYNGVTYVAIYKKEG